MTNMISCKFTRSSSNVPMPSSALYRLSYFHSDDENSLLRERPKYNECKVDQKDGTFDIEIDDDINTLKGYNINIYFYCDSVYFKSHQSSFDLAYWCEINNPDQKSVVAYEQGFTPNNPKLSVGQVSYKGKLPQQNKTYLEKIEKQVAKAQQDIEQRVVDAYYQLDADRGFTIENSSYFEYVNETKSKLPVIFFPIMSLFTGWSNSMDAISYFSNLLEVAKFNCGVSPRVSIRDLLEEKNYNLCGCIIQEVFSLPVRCLQYRDDRCTKRDQIDRWTVLSIHPRLSRSSFDCEDGARFMLDMFCALMKLHSLCIKVKPESDLNHLCGFMSYYTPFACIGDLRVKKVSIHQYCVLLDTRYVESVENNTNPSNSSSSHSYLPSIHLESTHHSLGLWNGEYEVGTNEESAYERVNSNMSDMASIFGISRHLLRLRAPLVAKMKKSKTHNPLYMNARVLMSPLYKNKAVQFLVTQYKSHESSTQKTTGSVADLMTHSNLICLETLIKLDVNKDIENEYAELLSILPCGLVPDKPTQKKDGTMNNFNTQIKYETVFAHIEIQENYYNQNQSEYDKLVSAVASKSHKNPVIHKKTFKLTSDISIVQFWLCGVDSSHKKHQEEKTPTQKESKGKK